jgi:hypothetical protein
MCNVERRRCEKAQRRKGRRLVCSVEEEELSFYRSARWSWVCGEVDSGAAILANEGDMREQGCVGDVKAVLERLLAR